QRSGHRKRAKFAALIEPSVRLDTACVETVGESVADRTARADTKPLRRVGADGDLRFMGEVVRGLLRDDVDYAADRAFAVEHGGWPAQDLDALGRPRVERKRDGSRSNVKA